MLVSKSCLILALSAVPAMSWAPSFSFSTTKNTALLGYLDNLSRELQGVPDEEKEAELDRNAMNLEKEKQDRFGVGDWSGFVDFDEFDGGDGQMGVAGDGKKGLDKAWKKEAHFANSRARSAKNAWGTSTGYAEELKNQGIESTRAQQLENWANQQELRNARNQQRFMSDSFDQGPSADDDWRKLSKFGVDRNQNFDLDQAFGAVIPGPVTHHIELVSRVNRAEVFEFNLLNAFMGYSDFRARFTPETSLDWTVEPSEGSLNGKKGTDFIVKFRPSNPGISSGYLVIQTESDKWTFQVTGTGSM